MSIEYDIYIKEHRDNVIKAYFWLKENLPGIFDLGDLHWTDQNELFNQICKHDKSKNDPEEYEAYDDYFYHRKSSRSSFVMMNFHYAWLRHQHLNPHHWQHWVLIPDTPGEKPSALPMPAGDILEMVCDWMSFSFKEGNGRYGKNVENGKVNIRHVLDFYEEHKTHLILHKDSRQFLENILDQIERKLNDLDKIND